MTGWPLVALHEIVSPIERAEFPVLGKIYRQIGVKWWGEGAYERERIDGGSTRYPRFFQVNSGDLVINKIWTRHGSVCIIPDELSGCYVSNEFPVFTLNAERVERGWLHWLTKTRWLWEECAKRSQGTSGKNRIRPEEFLRIAIPLPPLGEQRRIVARLRTLMDKVREIGTLRQSVSEERQGLMNAVRRSIIGDEPTHRWIPLRHYVKELENGWSPACENRPSTENEWGVLKLGAVSFGKYRPEENKALPISLQPLSVYEIKVGDFLMTRANTTELVGACVLVGETRPQLMLCDKIFRFIFRLEAPMNRLYLAHILKSPALRGQIEKAATGTSTTMKNISKEKVFRLLVPQHSPAEQEEIARTLGQAEEQQNLLTRLDSAVSNELDTLPRSILNRAYSGQL